MKITRGGRVVSLTLVALLFAAAAGCASSDSAGPSVKVISSDPRAVSGEDALLEVKLSTTQASTAISVRANGKEASSSFRFDAALGAYRGLVTGLVPGDNLISVADADGRTTSIHLRDSPITGPIFSGTHQTPYVCQTQTFTLPDGSKLGPSLDADCSATTVVKYVYWSTTSSSFKPYTVGVAPPSDVATTTTSTGTNVNYIVRVETGTINRAIYQIAILHDPNQDAAPTFTAPPKGWNNRLVYSFGGGAKTSYRQGNALGAVLNNTFLSKGYAVASSTMNGQTTDVNDVRSAEAASMVKEHFIETFGPPLFTLAWGLSAGTQNQFLIAQNYPGILDGMAPTWSYSDNATILQPAMDCWLLKQYFDKSGLFTQGQKSAVAGFYSWETCELLPTTQSTGLTWIGGKYHELWMNPALGCDAVVPTALRYDPVANRSGARCDVVDNQINLYGKDTTTSFARRPWDNVGVQYGLAAFVSGSITADQFLDLNEKIGGYDVDGNVVSQRMHADPTALDLTYRAGRVNEMRNLDQLAIVEYRPYRDALPDLHDRVRSLIIRQRLLNAFGSAGNHMHLTYDLSNNSNTVDAMILDIADRWLTGAATDTTDLPRAQKVAAHRPQDAQDGCLLSGGVRVNEPLTASTTSQCNAAFPIHSDPRLVAGLPLASDIIKCTLKNPSDQDYAPQVLTADQKARLTAIFPEGVCDFSKPGVSQGTISSTWLDYSQPGSPQPLGSN